MFSSFIYKKIYLLKNFVEENIEYYVINNVTLGKVSIDFEQISEEQKLEKQVLICEPQVFASKNRDKLELSL